MKTYSAKPDDIKKDWILIDADGLIVGRLAALIARRLRGKHKAIFTPHMDCGDCVVVINAAKVAFTGNKRNTKTYYWHTGYPGGIKSRKAHNYLDDKDGKHADRVLRKAVERMMPDGPLARKQLRGLHIYAGETHRHEAQKPKPLDVGSLNAKNKLRPKSLD